MDYDQMKGKRASIKNKITRSRKWFDTNGNTEKNVKVLKSDLSDFLIRYDETKIKSS